MQVRDPAEGSAVERSGFAAARSFGASTDGALGGAESMARTRTMPRRAFERTASPKPSRQGGGPGVEMEPLVTSLRSENAEEAKEAARSIRSSLKSSPAENRARLLAAGGIDAIMGLLRESGDAETVEHAMVVLLTMSLSEGVEPLITRNGGLEAVVGVMKSATPAAREAAAAAVFTLSGSLESKSRVRQAGGIPPLVRLLQGGSLRGKKDAALALFNLTLDEECVREMIAERAPEELLALLTVESEPGLEDKVMAVLANLCKHAEGRQAVLGAEGGLSALVDMLEGASPRAKEDAVVCLYLLGTHSHPTLPRILDEGAMPALTKLVQCGTPRAKTKGKALLELLRSSRLGGVPTASMTGGPQRSSNSSIPSSPSSSRDVIRSFVSDP